MKKYLLLVPGIFLEIQPDFSQILAIELFSPRNDSGTFINLLNFIPIVFLLLATYNPTQVFVTRAVTQLASYSTSFYVHAHVQRK